MADKPTTDKKGGKEKIKKWTRWITSPIIVITPIVVFLLFYSENSYINKTDNQERIDELRAEIKLNIDSTIYYERKSRALDTDKEHLEKIAREQYGMKRDNEDVYVTDIK
ncbi:MAG: septum formation initiator family protein [Muribaculaceae bacterium]